MRLEPGATPGIPNPRIPNPAPSVHPWFPGWDPREDSQEGAGSSELFLWEFPEFQPGMGLAQDRDMSRNPKSQRFPAPGMTPGGNSGRSWDWDQDWD